jgi:UDP-N-acetylmuramate dehydrogenase
LTLSASGDASHKFSIYGKSETTIDGQGYKVVYYGDYMEDIRKRLDKICSMVEENVPMSSLTSFRTGGPAGYLVTPGNMSEVEAVLSFATENNIPLLTIGRATNILVSDRGFDGIVLATQRLNRISVENESIRCESGVRLSTLIKTSLAHSLTGAEFLAGIPGTLGGAVISNAGLKTVWLSEILKEIEVLPIGGGKPYTLPCNEIDFGYRSSGIEDLFICKVEVTLKEGTKERIQEEINGYMEKRMLSQPLEYASAGSVFKNPPGHFAGELIEKCGLKGYCKGDACTSEKHANFIINKGNATSEDIYRVIKSVKEKIKRVYNINLETEIRIVGKF